MPQKKTKQPHCRVLIIAGEASGDLHGASLVKAVKARPTNTSIHFIGIGGQYMQEAGVELIMKSDELSVVGIIEVITKLNQLYKAKQLIKEQLHHHKPDLVVLIDYPGFNLHIAKLAKEAGIKVLYYISPQIWAWRRGRLKKIKRYVDHMMVILPFETKYYEDADIPVTFVGHPLTEAVMCDLTAEQAREKIGIPTTDQHVVGLMPGSRTQEIQRLLPEMLKAASQLLNLFPDIQFVLPLASTITRQDIDDYLKHYKHHQLPIIFTRNIYTAIQASDVVIVASGTATLEIGLLETPMVILYKLSWLSYGIGKCLVHLSAISLCNIILGKRVCPELLQQKACAKTIVKEVMALLNNPSQYAETVHALQQLKPLLDKGNAAKNAATVFLELLDDSK